MELIGHLQLGFAAAAGAQNLLACFTGALLGTLIGVLPGLGPVATIALLLPLTYGLPPLTALIMLAGIYYGAQYGGSTTSILLNLPGEASSVVTCRDGHPLAKKGRAGTALAVAALGSFFAGCVGTLFLAACAPLLMRFALDFGPAEYCSLMLFGLSGAVAIASRSLLKSLAMVVLGLLLGLIGTDANSGVARYTFGLRELDDGVGTTVLAVGVFGFAELLHGLEHACRRTPAMRPCGRLWPDRADTRRAVPAVLRGTALGTLLGLLPGAGALLPAFASYALEKACARDPARFGQGAIEGVAGPESANNAAAQTAFIPMLTLGIPSNAIMALMIGALTLHDIQPGPQVIVHDPVLFWGLVASMWIGNAMLLVLNLPLIGLWVRLLATPYRLLYPAILLFCCLGLYALANRTGDLYLAALFGLLGYLLQKSGCETVPLLLGFVLGPLFEEHLRRALLLARGDASVFLQRPLSLALLLAALALILGALSPTARRARRQLATEPG